MTLKPDPHIERHTDPLTERYSERRRLAERAAREAGAFIRSRAGQVQGLEVRDKGLNELVTDVDEAAQELIQNLIRAEFPNDDVLAEEGAAASFVGAGLAEDCWRWIVDPIDGTTNFTHGVAPYAVSIAVQHGARLVIGVVYNVPADLCYVAVDGGGLTCNGVPARVSQTDKLSDSLLTTGFPYRTFSHTQDYLEVLGRFMQTTQGVRRPGSASVDLARVASGQYDGFFESGLMPWDVAAGIVLVREGGGRVTDYSGGSDAVFDGQIIASNGGIHDAMMQIIAPLCSVRI